MGKADAVWKKASEGKRGKPKKTLSIDCAIGDRVSRRNKRGRPREVGRSDKKNEGKR